MLHAQRPGKAPYLFPLLVVLAGSLGCAATGCAASGKAGAPRSGNAAPEWPERPLPAYPAADQDALLRTEPNKGETGAGSGSPGTSSQLAKQYAGRATVQEIKGQATYYADSLAGNHTASGDIYDPRKHTAAHRKLPFGTVLRVTRTDTGAVTYVTVNDRGPFGSSRRIIDLSRAAAEDLAMMRAGVVDVLVEVLDKPN